MGRTIPSFRIAGAMEESKWRPFRALLSKKDRKLFDDMLRIPRLYNSNCVMACRPVVFHSVAISILFHHYKQLCRSVTNAKAYTAVSAPEIKDCSNNGKINSIV